MTGEPLGPARGVMFAVAAGAAMWAAAGYLWWLIR